MCRSSSLDLSSIGWAGRWPSCSALTSTRPDTPARLEAALAAAVERLGGSGRPRVTRHPAGLTTPESWQIRLASIEPDVADAIRAATRTGHFATMETR